MQPISTTSRIFAADQQLAWQIDTWDTPFSVLESDIASGGILFDLREPLADGTFTLSGITGGSATAASAYTAWTTASNSRSVISGGRTPNLIGYWAGGAPGQHGASVERRVAYRFRCYLRSTTGRAWFDAATNPTLTLALAGNGRVVVFKVVGGVTSGTAIYNEELREVDFVLAGSAGGFRFSPTISNMAAGDYLDIYYVQDGQTWGGFVIKAIQGTMPATDAAKQAAGRAAPIVGAALFDDNVALTKRTVAGHYAVSIDHQLGASANATIDLPLINPDTYDGVGWEWVRAGADDPGLLRWHGFETNVGTGQATVVTFDLKRQRLIRIKGGFTNELYTLFTGFVDDWELSGAGVVTLRCAGFEQRLVDQFVKNYPDKVSYMACGYRQRSGISEPVYETAAYDNWPIEYALRDLLARAGIDDSRTMRPLTVAKSDGTSAGVVYGSDTYRKFRARSMSGVLLLLERPVHYGNAGAAFSEQRPADDTYLFPPENTRELWNRCRDIADRYGYDVRFDEFGDAILQPRSNPHYVYDLTTGGTAATHPSAYGGTYRTYTGSVGMFSTQVKGARIDLITPRAVALGSWSFSVKRASDSAVMATGTIDPSLPAGSPDVFYYDFRSAVDGTNATVATLYTGDFDTYNVELTGTASADRRLDCFMVYHTDPATPRYPQTLSTVKNAISVRATPTMSEMRNQVFIVGRRKAAVTDSAKLNTNPENPDSEFVVERAVDSGSVADPAASNFIGYPKESVIYDDRITDQDFAGYLARTFIYRQRVPQPIASIEHTLLPALQLRDPVYAVEEGYDTIDGTVVLFVTGIQHKFDGKQATTHVETTSFPEFPAYEPREDIDLAAFGNNPVVNIAVTYKSLTNHTKTNLGPDEAYLSRDTDDVVDTGQTISVTAGSPDYLNMSGQPWPPIPGTVQVALPPGSSAGTASTAVASTNQNYYKSTCLLKIDVPQYDSLDTSIHATGVRFRMHQFGSPGTRVSAYMDLTKTGSQRFEERSLMNQIWCYFDTGALDSSWWLTGFDVEVYYYMRSTAISGWMANNPNHHFLNVDYRDGTRRIYLPWKEGDCAAPYARLGSSLYVRYRRLGPVDGGGAFSDPYASTGAPFYDPYTSEVGNLVHVTFDTLVSGLYRISICSTRDDTVVGWLTNPTVEAGNPEGHWQYMTAGSGRALAWDGVDQVGAWNRQQSQDYADTALGAFEQDQRPIIGAGYYAWNEERVDGAAPPLVLIAGLRDSSTGKPVFGQGTHAKWYVRFEVQHVSFDGAVRQVCTNDPLQNSKKIGSSYNPLTGSAAQALIYTHVPEPTRVELSVADFSAGTYNENDQDAGTWSTPDAAATICNTKPLRFRFKVRPRPGTLWTGLQDEVTVKLFRQVHLRATVFDMFAVHYGTSFQSDFGTYYERREIRTSRHHIDTHTLSYQDDGYRKASTLKWSDGESKTQWVFRPQDFKKNFRGVDNESLIFGDYLQLGEDLPKWNESRDIASEWSRYILGFISYLFYFSAYTQDRSGRFVWCLDRKFLDKTKILKNAYSDWWGDPELTTWTVGQPPPAADSTTYRLDWPDDPIRDHRRSVITRQWTDSSNGTYTTGWVSGEASRWGFASSTVGYKLLRHQFVDHDSTSANLNGSAWPTLSLDNHSKWLADNGGLLPSSYANLTRQLGSWNGGSVTTSLAGTVASWTWEGAPVYTLWIPCVTRDFHPYFMVPPMIDRAGDSEGVAHNVYEYEREEDVAVEGGDVWNSYVYDMREAYGDKTRFSPPSVCQVNPANNQFDYGRQDELVHYEDLRGVFTRGPAPARPPRKVNPARPYYINPYRYTTLSNKCGSLKVPAFWSMVLNTFGQPVGNYPVTTVKIGSWFNMKFRSEYLWDSGSQFPCGAVGGEMLDMVNAARTRFYEITDQRRACTYTDSGAWVGWKDDIPNSGESDPNYKLTWTGDTNYAFALNFMPLAVGPVLSTTVEMYFHLLLLNERRLSPVAV